MRITIERLRQWFLAAGVVLVLAIVSFLVYAKHRMRQIGRDLPGKLGLNIQESTNDFTVSRSRAGHTQFVLHASKAVQYKGGGHLVLHDVSILLYSKDGSEADKISGSQFDYDQSAGIARADGTVDIEMAAPSVTAGKAGANLPARSPKGPIRVKTSGLIFNQKTQVASTDQPLTFQDGDVSGSATGATYDGENGTLALARDVILHAAVDNGKGAESVTIQAQGADFNRELRQLVLIRSLTEYEGTHQTADQSTVSFRPDGSAEHVLAEGNVHVVTETGSDLKAGDADAKLDAHSGLQQVHLTGGVLLIARDDLATSKDHRKDNQTEGLAALQTLHADSDSGTLTFGPRNTLQHLQLVHAVSVVDQQVGLPDDAHGSETRELRAGKVDVSFGPDERGKAEAKDVLANGAASVTVHTIHATAPQQSTTVQGDQLYATLAEGHQLSSLRGDGHTYLLQTSPGGVSQTGSADTLMVKFAPPTPGTAAGMGNSPNAGKMLAAMKETGANLPGAGSGSQVVSAEQQGHVLLAQIQPSATPGGPPVKTTAKADHLTYDGRTGKIDLTGGTPRIEQTGSELAAAAVEFNRWSGDAYASGGVKATFANDAGKAGNKAPAAGGDSIHVVADHAALNHAADETTFFGSPHADARLWENANSITAPMIVLARKQQLLTAGGPDRSVKATFVEEQKSNGGQPSMMRIASGLLTYSGGEHKAVFSHGVVAEGQEGTMQASVLALFLRVGGAPSTTPVAANGPILPGAGGQIDRLVATGRVDLRQGDRRCTGEKLVYTADDERFVLTGTAGAPPRVTDPVHGSVTGGSLIFNNRDDSVVVNRGQSGTETDTRTAK